MHHHARCCEIPTRMYNKCHFHWACATLSAPVALLVCTIYQNVYHVSKLCPCCISLGSNLAKSGPLLYVIRHLSGFSLLSISNPRNNNLKKNTCVTFCTMQHCESVWVVSGNGLSETLHMKNTGIYSKLSLALSCNLTRSSFGLCTQYFLARLFISITCFIMSKQWHRYWAIMLGRQLMHHSFCKIRKFCCDIPLKSNALTHRSTSYNTHTI